MNTHLEPLLDDFVTQVGGEIVIVHHEIEGGAEAKLLLQRHELLAPGYSARRIDIVGEHHRKTPAARPAGEAGRNVAGVGVNGPHGTIEVPFMLGDQTAEHKLQPARHKRFDLVIGAGKTLFADQLHAILLLLRWFGKQTDYRICRRITLAK